MGKVSMDMGEKKNLFELVWLFIALKLKVLTTLKTYIPFGVITDSTSDCTWAIGKIISKWVHFCVLTGMLVIVSSFQIICVMAEIVKALVLSFYSVKELCLIR